MADKSFRQLIEAGFQESIAVKQAFLAAQAGVMEQVAAAMIKSLRSGGKIMFFGNGGSAADAQHLTAEFVNRFRIERPPLAALALSTDTSILTSIGNDYSFDDIFTKQIRALGKPEDLAFGISTSGNSPNVLKGLTAAREKKIVTVGMTGEGGGKMREACDYLLAVPSKATPRIQETHITIGHLLCELVDVELFGKI